MKSMKMKTPAFISYANLGQWEEDLQAVNQPYTSVTSRGQHLILDTGSQNDLSGLQLKNCRITQPVDMADWIPIKAYNVHIHSLELPNRISEHATEIRINGIVNTHISSNAKRHLKAIF